MNNIPNLKKSEFQHFSKQKTTMEKVRPRLKEVFDKVDRNGSSTMEILEFKEALNLLNFEFSTETAENFFEETILTSKDVPNKTEINFDEFIEAYQKIIEIYGSPFNTNDYL